MFNIWIKDLATKKIHKYGSDCHDSLTLSDNGTSLHYYNLQNGDGSRFGDYKNPFSGGYVFSDEKGRVPEEICDPNEYENSLYGGIGRVSPIDAITKEIIDMRETLVKASENPNEPSEIKDKLNSHRAGEIAGYDRVLALLEEFKNND